jgi:hypothetical protein
MKKTTTIVALLFLIATLSFAQFAQWNTVTGVHDDSPNGTGHQTISVGVVNANVMVALVNRPRFAVATVNDVFPTPDSALATYLVGYKNWGIETGRLGTYNYGSAATLGLFSKWFSGFDEVYLYRAYKLVVTPDSLVYVANNDPDHNILVFKVTSDTVESTEYRMKTGSVDIHGLAVDNNGYVYVSAVYGTSSDSNNAEIKVFKGIKAPGSTWGSSFDEAPITTINLPFGVYRGLTVSGDGKQLFVSEMTGRKIMKYTGSPTTGYTAAPAFQFTMTDADTIPGTEVAGVWSLGRPLGMTYLNGNNLLFLATARWLGNSIRAQNNNSAYSYSKVFMLNPNNGARLDSIDIAKYYLDNGGSGTYTTQIFTAEKFISGYASSYDLVFDETKALYTQSMYSWTVEKWAYSGTLPTITIGSVQRTSDLTPENFALAQNFPNPFNPSTSIQFSLSRSSDVSLKVYDILGKEVATLVSGAMGEGTYTATFDARELSSGLYFYTLRAGSFVETKKMMLTK